MRGSIVAGEEPTHVCVDRARAYWEYDWCQNRV
jgi:hypothetical protein